MFQYCIGSYVSVNLLKCSGVGILCCWCFPGVHPAGRWLGQNFYRNQTPLFNIYKCCKSAPGFHTVSCTGPWWVVIFWYMSNFDLYNILEISMLLVHNSIHYWANNSPIVCVVSTLGSWNYCFGVECPTALYLHHNVCLRWLHWIRGSCWLLCK